MEITPVHKRQRKYDFDLSEKKKLLIQAQNSSAAEVCRTYGIAKGTFSGWKTQVDLDLDYKKGQYTLHPGRKSIGEHLENVIHSFIEGQEKDQRECSVSSIVLHIIAFDPDFKGSNFSAVRKWLYPYLQRNGYSIRSKTLVALKECL